MNNTQLRDKITREIQVHMKTGEKIRLNVLRGILTEIVFEEKKGHVGTLLEDQEVLVVLVREKKKYEESAMFAEQAGRTDLLTEAQQNIQIITDYLPAQVSEDEVKNLIQGIIENQGPFTVTSMGAVMKILSPQIKGTFDGKKASELVKILLLAGTR